MDISEVRVKLVEDAGDRLQGFCSVTFDDSFVVRDLKIIEGTNGPFVAMPSRKLTARCPKCGCKNHLRAGYCNQCGGELKDDRVAKDDKGRPRLFADIAHPINAACREKIQGRIILAFREELSRAKLPGYVSNYDEIDAGDFDEFHEPSGNGSASGGAAKTDSAAVKPPVTDEGTATARRPKTGVAPQSGGSSRTTEVQPPETPHGPHGAAARPAAQSPPAAPRRRKGFGEGFGKGIVD